MPTMRDERFSRAVIYLCAHSDEGAMGIVVNQPAANVNFRDLLVQLDVVPAANLIEVPPRAEAIRVLKGGPVETGRGFVLHSADFFIENSTLPIDDGICLTATLDILKAIARGQGPVSAVLALGYAGWAPGQLENEIHANGWLHCPADSELIFGGDAESKYTLAHAEDRHRSRKAIVRSRTRLKISSHARGGAPAPSERSAGARPPRSSALRTHNLGRTRSRADTARLHRSRSPRLLRRLPCPDHGRGR